MKREMELHFMDMEWKELIEQVNLLEYIEDGFSLEQATDCQIALAEKCVDKGYIQVTKVRKIQDNSGEECLEIHVTCPDTEYYLLQEEVQPTEKDFQQINVVIEQNSVPEYWVWLSVYFLYLKDKGLDYHFLGNSSRKKVHEYKFYHYFTQAMINYFTWNEEPYLKCSNDDLEVADLLQVRGYVYSEYKTIGSRSYFYTVLPTDLASSKDHQEIRSFLENKQGMIPFDRHPFPWDDEYYSICALAGYLDYLRKTQNNSYFLQRREEFQQKSMDEQEIYIVRHTEILATENAIHFAKKNHRLCATMVGSNRGKIEDYISDIQKELAENLQVSKIAFPIASVDMWEFIQKISEATKEYKSENPNRSPSSNLLLSNLLPLPLLPFSNKKLIVFRNVGGFLSNRESNPTLFRQAIELLEIYIENSYLIFLGNQIEIDALLHLSEKISLLVGENQIVVKDQLPIELFSAYQEKLKKLKGCATEEEIQLPADFYAREFKVFLEENTRYIPFQNEDLSSYLAEYSNLHSDSSSLLPKLEYLTLDGLKEQVIGLDNVMGKLEEFEEYLKYLHFVQLQGTNLPDANLHMIFKGNPGTGKTVVARLVAELLFHLGIVSENKVIEVDRKDLVAGFVGQSAEKTAKVIEDAMGGVLFIDEAYALTPSHDTDFGHEVISTLIKAMEDYKGKFVVIFAGYEKEMNDFIQTNPGIDSRIGYKFTFPDYTAEELMEITLTKLHNIFPNCSLDADFCDKLERIYREFAGRRNFGNGRFVDKLLQQLLINRSKRNFDKNNYRFFQIEDIPNPQELVSTDSASGKSSGEILDGIIGIENVKKTFEELKAFAQLKRDVVGMGAENLEVRRDDATENGQSVPKKLQVPNAHLHMTFYGNPGTGKTTVARLVAQMLFEMGLTLENKLIQVTRKDLVAEHIGQTAPLVEKQIQRALGGVLFIDEAYSLKSESGNDFGDEAIATLIQAMEDQKDNLVVIFAGYEKEMNAFLQMNAGLQSRIGFNFRFADYETPELMKIFEIKLKDTGFQFQSPLEGETDVSTEKLTDLFNYFCHVENFGNGRFVDQLLQKIMMNHAQKRAKLEETAVNIISTNSIPTKEEFVESMQDGGLQQLTKKLSESEAVNRAMERVAVHELGHAFLQMDLFPTKVIRKITIKSEGTGTLGYVEMDSTMELQNTATDYRNNIAVRLAGLAAEEVIFGQYADGGGSDIESGKQFAIQMLNSGMSKYGFLGSGTDAGRIEEINEILKEEFFVAKGRMQQMKPLLENAKNYLVKEKEITTDKLKEFLGNSMEKHD